jgi:D-alanyl-D-alanine endopeptidase (penicillin-binding protein 7)
MRRPGLGILLLLLFCLFQIPGANAATPKPDSAQKSVKKKPVKKAGQTKLSRTKSRPARAARHRPAKSKVAKVHIKARHKARHAPARRTAAVQPVFSAAHLAGLGSTADSLRLNSNVAYVLDGSDGTVLFQKNADAALPIASLTKLMTALVVVESGQDMKEILEVTPEDIDRIKGTSSRLPIGAKLSRADMLHIALMSSENRAASALGRNYPGGLRAFVAAMNAKAKELGMTHSNFIEPTGLSSFNIASASDLSKLVIAARAHPLMAEYSTNGKYAVDTGRGQLHYINSNRLVRMDDWDIDLQKTGYISEAGRCMVMHVTIANRPLVMVFLDADGSYARMSDANRMREWVVDQMREQATVQAMLEGQPG